MLKPFSGFSYWALSPLSISPIYLCPIYLCMYPSHQGGKTLASIFGSLSLSCFSLPRFSHGIRATLGERSRVLPATATPPCLATPCPAPPPCPAKHRPAMPCDADLPPCYRRRRGCDLPCRRRHPVALLTTPCDAARCSRSRTVRRRLGALLRRRRYNFLTSPIFADTSSRYIRFWRPAADVVDTSSRRRRSSLPTKPSADLPC